MSTLMFWNKQNSNSNSSNNNNNSSTNQNNEAKNAKNGRNWLHAPDVLLNGHVAYLVKVNHSICIKQRQLVNSCKNVYLFSFWEVLLCNRPKVSK
jgi:PTB domain-containing engulfment adapter protein 1